MGSAVGSIRELFEKVKSIDAKHGKFDLVLCIGDFFGPLESPDEVNPNDETSQLLDGKLEGVFIITFYWIFEVDRDAREVSTDRMLHNAGRSATSRTSRAKVCENRRRTVQECISHECVLTFVIIIVHGNRKTRCKVNLAP